ncbi:VCBS repeat-containing protein [bacterium]|nr:VCBS repeat-containing protein [bacterium]
MKRYFLTFAIILLVSLLTSPIYAQLWPDQTLPSWQGDNNGPVGVFDYDNDGDLDVWLMYGPLLGSINHLPNLWGEYQEGVQDIAFAQDGDWIDFDQDGDIDFVFYGTMINEGRLAWLEYLGDGQFDAHLIQEFTEGYTSGRSAAGDIDGDGDIDIVTNFDLNGGSQGFSTWYQQPDGSFVGVLTNNSMAGFPQSDLGDLNCDGLLDFVTPSLGALDVYFAQLDQTWDMIHIDVTDLQSNSYSEPKLGDFDQDGDLDIAVFQNFIDDYPDDWPATVSWYENSGVGDFTEHVIYQQDYGTDWVIAILDADSDGDTDLAVRHLLLLNQGDNVTFDSLTYTDISIPFIDQLIAADIDNDGDTDLLDEEVRWFVNPTNDPPQFIIRLVPRQTTVPSAGGEVVFDGMVYNQFPQPLEGHVWADVTGPNGTTARVWHRLMTFPNGEWLTWPDLGLTVPGNLIDGEYRLTVRGGAAGYGFVPGDSLRFVKEGVGR